MRLLPKDRTGKIQFCQAHLEKWAEHAAEIGIDPDEVAELAGLIDEAREAMRLQGEAKAKAQSATLRAQGAIERMSTAAQTMILQIKGEAARSGNQVYIAASIALPAKGSPIAAPGKPHSLEYALQGNGALKLSWQCDNPRGSQGTIYQISRSVDRGELKFVGGTGKKKFLDESIPAGITLAMYQIRAVRSTKVGPWACFNVNLGMTKGSPRSMVLQRTQWAAA